VTLHRREVLGTLGVASASTLLWALGCGPHAPPLRRAPQVSGEVRTWLHDAVARLASSYPTVHALAVSRRRTTAALDVLGSGVGRLRSDGVILTVRGRDGAWREHLTTELTEAGIDAAARALDAPRQRKALDFGRAPATPDEPPRIDDHDLRQRLELLLQSDARLSSRIVYAAALIDIDDAIVWSVAPGRDLEQRLVRIRQAATRAAWNGTRPAVRDVEHAWAGWLDDQPLTADDLTATSHAALELMTPGSFDDGERAVVLDPSVVAILLDAAVRGLFTSTAARRPEVSRRVAALAPLASSLVTLVDDPTAPRAYGGFAFDDEGEPAAPITLLDAGRVAARLSDHAGGGAGRGRRPGHLARVEPAASHLHLVPGTLATEQLYGDGFLLEGGLGATLDPGTDRVRVACARARELRSGSTTGRVYPDVELVGSLTAVLCAVDAVANAPASFALHGPSDREPAWRSISAPALRTRGLVRARRSRA
jgi:predicted Zn-dependent protease